MENCVSLDTLEEIRPVDYSCGFYKWKTEENETNKKLYGSA